MEKTYVTFEEMCQSNEYHKHDKYPYTYRVNPSNKKLVLVDGGTEEIAAFLSPMLEPLWKKVNR